jgi:haloacetate dehalogenase
MANRNDQIHPIHQAYPTDPTDGESFRIDRRDLLRQMTALATGAMVGGLGSAEAQEGGSTLRFFPGFKAFKVQTSGAMINGVVGGQGPPLLLLHGAPQTHISWRLVAPQLATNYTVVAADLRGYGDSSKPPDGENHANYSKRAMALDQVEVMKHFGFDRFPVVGHDRGGRVAHRMALDHADKVTKAAVLDIIPTYYLYTHVTIEFVQAYFHWFNYLRPAPGPENDLKAAADAQKSRATSEIQIEYLRTSSDPANIHAMCEDYRAGASIDLQHDKADLDKKIACPLLVLWGERGAMGRLYDVMPIWRERGSNVTGKGLPGGHNLQEELPEQVLAELRDFLKA